MQKFTEFSLIDGRVIGHIDARPSVVRSSASTVVLEGSWPGAAWYLLDGSISQRPALFSEADYTLAAGDSLRVDDVPPGTIVQVGGEWTAVDDGSLEMVFSVVGTHRIHLMPAFPYLHQVLAVTVDAH